MTAAEIAVALGGYRGASWQRCRCPVHQSNSLTLALRDSPFGLQLKCWAGCARDDVLSELRRLGLLYNPDSDDGDVRPKPDPAEVAHQREAATRHRQRRIAEALDFWKHETAPPYGTVVERYWLARGLALPIPPTIRASRSWLRHPSGGTRLAMVALVQHVEYGPVAIHRTG
jgi:hypothetical protein